LELLLARDDLGSRATAWRDRITGRERGAVTGEAFRVTLRPYEVLWLTPDDDVAPAP
jgi:hypothetical protein